MALVLLDVPAAEAQRVRTGVSWLEATPNSELEGYLRALQLDASTPRLQGLRTDVADELRRAGRSLPAHPWRARLARDTTAGGGIYLLRPAVGMVVNTNFPFGTADGAVWAGRGLTVAARAGAVVVAGPLSVRIEPVLLRAQNDAFALFDPARPGDRRFADPLEPEAIDLPQRFGARPFQRLDLGDSEIRVAGRGLAVGLSHALQGWGPATAFPLVLGAGAPGFAHAYAGTARPVSVGLARVHARVLVGRLEQSAISSTPDSLAVRLASAAVVTLVPRGLPNFEVGGTRFFHRRWRAGDLAAAWRVPFEGLLFKEGQLRLDDTTSTAFLTDNQLASAFFRWRLPGAGAEVYGEFARNDASFNLRELITQPDHSTAYTLGARARRRRRADRLLVVGGEVVNARITHLDRVRPQARLYQHAVLTQGHTHRGQLLAAAAALGGAGATVTLDEYTPSGRSSVSWERAVRLGPLREGADGPGAIDVTHALRIARTHFRGGVDLSAGGTLVWELNRDFRRDAFNFRLELGARFPW